MAITLVVTPWVRTMAIHAEAMAVPRPRDVHEVPTPRWGGIAIYLGVMAAVIFTVTFRHIRTGGVEGWNWHLGGTLIAATFIAIVGIIDDLKDLRAIYQALAIILAGAILIAFNVRIEGITNPLVAESTGSYDPHRWIPLAFPVSVIG